MCLNTKYTKDTKKAVLPRHRVGAESTRNMTMKNPPHPGLTVKFDCLDELGLSVAQGAKALGVTRQTLNNLVSGKSGISPEMAVRLSKAFGSSP